MKKAFTMIELIFIIVIIGILASIAIPKLMASRDDAKKVMELNNIANCIEDIGTNYTARGVEIKNSRACLKIKCAVIKYGDMHDGNITVILKDSTNGYPKYCNHVKNIGHKKNLDNNFVFGGSGIKI